MQNVHEQSETDGLWMTLPKRQTSATKETPHDSYWKLQRQEVNQHIIKKHLLSME